MDPEEIDQALTAIEKQIDAGDIPDLGQTGFWRTVRALKTDPSVVDRFAGRIGEIDHTVFAAWARVTIPIRVGTGLAILGAVIGISLVAASSMLPQWNGIVFLAGTGVMIGTTHGLGHIAAGYFGGIRFTSWFVGRGRPQPGVKTEYASYLEASPRARAWMHASGAIVTKAIPFLLLPVAMLTTAIPIWVSVILVILGIAQIITDIVWSTKSSDWAKFRREIAYTRD